MISLLKAFRIITGVGKEKKSYDCETEDVCFFQNNLTISFKRYFKQKKSQKTVIVFPGLTHLGNNSPRLIKLCKVLAENNFEVFCPEYHYSKKYLINVKEVVQVRRTIESVYRKKKQKLYIIAPSFSGALVLGATQQIPESIINSVCIVGCGISIDRLVNDILHKENEFLLLVAVLNFFTVFGKTKTEAVNKLIDPEFKIKDKNLQKILSDQGERLKIWENSKENIDFKIISQMFEGIKKKLYVIKYPLFILHGENDPIISKENAYDIACKVSGPVFLCFTSFLDHANFNFSFLKLRHFFQLLFGFNFWLKPSDNILKKYR